MKARDFKGSFTEGRSVLAAVALIGAAAAGCDSMSSKSSKGGLNADNAQTLTCADKTQSIFVFQLESTPGASELKSEHLPMKGGWLREPDKEANLTLTLCTNDEKTTLVAAAAIVPNKVGSPTSVSLPMASDTVVEGVHEAIYHSDYSKLLIRFRPGKEGQVGPTEYRIVGTGRDARDARVFAANVFPGADGKVSTRSWILSGILAATEDSSVTVDQCSGTNKQALAGESRTIGSAKITAEGCSWEQGVATVVHHYTKVTIEDENPLVPESKRRIVLVGDEAKRLVHFEGHHNNIVWWTLDLEHASYKWNARRSEDKKSPYTITYTYKYSDQAEVVKSCEGATGREICP